MIIAFVMEGRRSRKIKKKKRVKEERKNEEKKSEKKKCTEWIESSLRATSQLQRTMPKQKKNYYFSDNFSSCNRIALR